MNDYLAPCGYVLQSSPSGGKCLPPTLLAQASLSIAYFPSCYFPSNYWEILAMFIYSIRSYLWSYSRYSDLHPVDLLFSSSSVVYQSQPADRITNLSLLPSVLLIFHSLGIEKSLYILYQVDSSQKALF